MNVLDTHSKEQTVLLPQLWQTTLEVSGLIHRILLLFVGELWFKEHQLLIIYEESFILFMQDKTIHGTQLLEQSHSQTAVLLLDGMDLMQETCQLIKVELLMRTTITQCMEKPIL